MRASDYVCCSNLRHPPSVISVVYDCIKQHSLSSLCLHTHKPRSPPYLQPLSGCLIIPVWFASVGGAGRGHRQRHAFRSLRSHFIYMHTYIHIYFLLPIPPPLPQPGRVLPPPAAAEPSRAERRRCVSAARLAELCASSGDWH